MKQSEERMANPYGSPAHMLPGRVHASNAQGAPAWRASVESASAFALCVVRSVRIKKSNVFLARRALNTRVPIDVSNLNIPSMIAADNMDSRDNSHRGVKAGDTIDDKTQCAIICQVDSQHREQARVVRASQIPLVQLAYHRQWSRQ